MTALFLFMTLTAQSASDTPVTLTDPKNDIVVTILPSVGNMAISMKVKGQEILWSPTADPAAMKAKPQLAGIPFLAPWANRVEGMLYWVNGKQYAFNPHLGNLRPDQNKNPIHGLAMFTDRWKSFGMQNSGYLSELRFGHHPDWLAQFPFPHTISMLYRLENGELFVETFIKNESSEPMPVAVGYHPYFQIPGGRDAWTIHIPAFEHVELSPALIPTGKRTPLTQRDIPLKGNKFDDVYTNLARDAEGRAVFTVSNGKQKLDVKFGSRYMVGVVYAPPGRDFVCFEPMAAITDAFNQHHSGKYPDLQHIPPGGTWREVWSIKPSGF
ncbi:MAG: aldose 1-epimerase [Bryobacteraceae bacterium]|nr:aldose 1-epimerase [Bryobacteraceae bacterium]